MSKTAMMALDELVADVPASPALATTQVTEVTEVQWTVRRGFEGGAVLFAGEPAFAAAFVRADRAQMEEFSQDPDELVLHDAENNLIFRDFQWEGVRPEDPEELAQLMLRMMRIVGAVLRPRGARG